jgi:hypothetical protein
MNKTGMIMKIKQKILYGVRVTIDKIEPMDTETGRKAFPLPAQLILRLLGRKDFVRLGVQRQES